jgi:dihydropteroate synthase
MGVLNVTPDSFSDGGMFLGVDAALRQVESMVGAGADVIDIGGYSSRPGADDVPVGEELARLIPVVRAIRDHFPTVPVSIDTFRARVAEEMLQLGAQMINDITAGRDPRMMSVVAHHDASYIAMHMQGTPQTMQADPRYGSVVPEVRAFLTERLATARGLGISDVWIDPGFGFGKTSEHNYALLAHLPSVVDVGAPVVVGLSRKSMFWRGLDLGPLDVLPATSAAHLWAILCRVRMLRVHDVAAARQVLRVAAEMRWTLDDAEGGTPLPWTTGGSTGSMPGRRSRHAP